MEPNRFVNVMRKVLQLQCSSSSVARTPMTMASDKNTQTANTSTQIVEIGNGEEQNFDSFGQPKRR